MAGLLAPLALVALVACEGELPAGTQSMAKNANQMAIDVSPAVDTLKIGETVQLTATPQPGRSWSNRNWSTSNAKVATVDKEGVVKGVGVGSATIQVKSGPDSGTSQILVVDSAAPAPPPPAAAASVVKVSGDGQSAVVGAKLASPLVVKVVDKNGAAVAGATVTWAAAQGAGTLSPATVVSDAQGQAGTSWTLGSATGTVQATASVGGLPPVTFTANATAAPVVISSVVIKPDSGRVAAGGTLTLAATVTDGAGASVGGATWTSLSSNVATVSSTGVVKGVAVGRAGIVASAGGKADTAFVTVTQTAARVVVTPKTATIATGATVQLSATVYDASGAVMSGASKTWTSVNPAIATVTALGLVSGVAGGTAKVVVAAGANITDTATITVNAPAPPSGGLANECASPRAGWIWCDDFDQDRLGRYFEFVPDNGSFSRASGVGMSGSSGMRARFNAGQVSAGSLKLAFGRTPSSYFRPVDAGTANYREIYWRVFVRNQPGWTGGGGWKLTRALSFASSNWAEAMIAHIWTGGTNSYLNTDPASGTDAAGNLKTTKYNDFANLRWLGAASGKTPLFDAAHVGQWYCVESHVRLNDAGQSNGVFEFWVNGNLEARNANLNWVGSYSAYGINAVFLENYWNTGSPQAQERYFDNLVVSTQPIGCG